MSRSSESPKKRKVLLIGWDAADWKVISPLMDAGKMPVLQSMVEEGVMGKLATLTPILSPMLWTSIATGKRPFNHGIYGFAEPDPKNGGTRPITNLSRTTKAIWNILGQEGLKSNVIGWWPSHPAEPINGVMVSNHFQKVQGDSPSSWPMMNGTVHPPELASELEKFRVHPSEIEAEQILPFIPRAAEVDQKKDKRVWACAKLLAECASVHACGTAVMQNEEWDFMGIYYDAIDHFCHAFMKYHPPRRDHIKEVDFEFYKDVVEGIYCFHDIMLGATLNLVDEETTVVLISDHGFHPDHLRPDEIPPEQNGPAIEHSHYGIFVAKGPGIKKDATVFGANLLDVTPTLLSLFGLPVGDDMDGRVLTEIWETPPELIPIPSWDEVEGDDGRHPAHFQYDPADDQALMKQLVDLGYVEDPGDDKSFAERTSLRELEFNKARAFIDAGRHGDSIPILEKLVEDWPQEFRFLRQLAFSLLSLKRTGEAREVIEKILEVQKESKKEIEEKYPEFLKRIEGREASDLKKEEIIAARSWKSKIKASSLPQYYLLGCLLVAEDEPKLAIKVFNRMSPERWRAPDLPIRMGNLHMSIDEDQKAEEYFKRALELDPQSSNAYQGLMELMLKLGRNREAAEYGLTSVGLLYFSPQSHYLLGKALLALKYYERAAEAFEVTLTQNPNFAEAYEHLADLYESFLKQPEKGRRYRHQASELIQERLKNHDAGPADDEPVEPMAISERGGIPSEWPEERIITIVSGLPRSGTSLMMQMLRAGGLTCFSDDIREADENNPKGYFELESVKELHRDATVLDGAFGKVVKVVAPIIPKLPEGEEYFYRVIFMERNLDEVFSSQVSMLKRLGKPETRSEPVKMKRSYAGLIAEVNGVLENRSIPTLPVSFGETIASPRETARRLNQFFGGVLDEDAMMGAVDSSLHREKK